MERMSPHLPSQTSTRRFHRRRLWARALWLWLLFAGLPALEAGVRLGSDRLAEEPYHSWLAGKRVGLITNQTGVNSSLVTTLDLLEADGQIQLTALFGPEHGLFGQAQAGEPVASDLRVFSLFGDTYAPTDEMLQAVDVLVYDIQDVGVRFYTVTSTLVESMKAAARKGIPFVVLDRPNPIGGVRVEGPVLEPGFESFVGSFPGPVRYGLSVGELARYLAGNSWIREMLEQGKSAEEIMQRWQPALNAFREVRAHYLLY